MNDLSVEDQLLMLNYEHRQAVADVRRLRGPYNYSSQELGAARRRKLQIKDQIQSLQRLAGQQHSAVQNATV